MLSDICNEIGIEGIEQELCSSCHDRPAREACFTCGRQQCVKQFVLETVKPDLEEFR